MNIIESNVDGLKHSFKVTLPSKDISQKIEQQLTVLGKNVQLPGFRKGKVPTSVLRQRYAGKATADAVEEMVEDTIKKVLAEKQIRPALRPDVNLDPYHDGQDLTLSITVEALPEVPQVSLDKYKFEKLVSDVTDAEIDKALERMRSNNKLPEDLKKPRGVKEEDLVFLKFKMTIDGKVIDSFNNDAGMPYLAGSGYLSAEVDAAILGQKPGHMGKSTVTLDDRFFPDHAGKVSDFEFEIIKIQELRLPTDEELSKELRLESPDLLRSTVKDALASSNNSMARDILKSQILDKLADDVVFTVPQGMVDLEFQTIWAEHEKSEASEGRILSELSDADRTKEEKELREIAERRVRLGLLLADIGMKNDIRVTKEEQSRALYDLSRQYPGQEAELLKYYRTNPTALASLQAPIFEEKVSDFIISKMTISEKNVTKEALTKAYEEEDDDHHVHDENCGHHHHQDETPKKAKSAKSKKAE